jgi:hypothetical protein
VERPHNREAFHEQLTHDYFYWIDPLFRAPFFRRSFWKSNKLFLRIMQGVRCYDDYFNSRRMPHVKLASLLTRNALHILGRSHIEYMVTKWMSGWVHSHDRVHLSWINV